MPVLTKERGESDLDGKVRQPGGERVQRQKVWKLQRRSETHSREGFERCLLWRDAEVSRACAFIHIAQT